MEEESKAKNLGIPIAIVIAGALIAGAIFYSNAIVGNKAADNGKEGSEVNKPIPPSPVNDKDHILGSPNATLKIIEYSDFECPFCKEFHKTMSKIIDEYGASGKVSWVYRHFPIESLHPKAKTEAIASECIAEIAGNNAFWQFVNRFFELSPSNNQTDLKILDQIVSEMGINKNKYDICMNSGKYDSLIKAEFDEAIKTGGNGTPWSIIVTSNGELYPVNGAQPYSVMKEIIDTVLKQ